MFNLFKFLFGSKEPEKKLTFPYSFGAEITKEEDIDIRTINVESFRPTVTNLASFPKKKITDISHIPVEYQLLNGTCTGKAIMVEVDYRVKRIEGFKPSGRFLYSMAKKIDGMPGVQGTRPTLLYKIVMNDGVASRYVVPEVDSATHSVLIDVPRTKSILDDAKLVKSFFDENGFAEIDSSKEAMVREIDQNELFTTTLLVDKGAWNNARLRPPQRLSGEAHRILVYGYEILENQDVLFFFRNSWGEEWGNKGNGEFLWSEYQNAIYENRALAKIPQYLIDEAKSKKFLFIGSPITFGQTGERVYQLQRMLQKEGFFPNGWENLTGRYGPITANSVLKWQIHNKVADLDTLARLRGRSFGPSSMKIANGPVEPKKLVDVLIQIESGGNDNAIGDKHLKDWAYGALQIRQPMVTDVNKFLGTNYKSKDCLGNRALSLKIFETYFKIYPYLVTDEEKAKAWNGGAGWKSLYGRKGYESYTRNLDIYWNKVKKALYS